MDYTQQQEATSSCSPSIYQPEELSTPVPGSSTEPKVLRSSARVKAAKQKEKERERTSVEQTPSSSLPTKRNRDTTLAKGKEASEESFRASKRYVSSALLHFLTHDFKQSTPCDLSF